MLGLLHFEELDTEIIHSQIANLRILTFLRLLSFDSQ